MMELVVKEGKWEFLDTCCVLFGTLLVVHTHDEYFEQMAVVLRKVKELVADERFFP